MHPDGELVGVSIVGDDVGAHLSAVVGEVDTLARLQLDAAQTAESGPDELGVTELAHAQPALEAHAVASVGCQVDAVVELRERRRRLHRLDHARVI